MMGNYKRKAAWFAFYDRVNIERELERMSEQGWIIDRPGSMFWRYRKAEPKKRKVSVVYVADVSAFSSQPTRGQELMQELCEGDGWTLEASWGQMQIYYSEREDQTPIETDPVTQVEAIHRAMKKSTPLTNLLNGAIWPLLVLYQFHIDPAAVLSDNLNLLLAVDGILMMLTSLLELGFAGAWYRKAVKAAQHGEYLEVWNHRKLTWVMRAASFVVLVLLLFCFADRGVGMLVMLVPIAVLMFVSIKMVQVTKESGLSNRANVAICVGTTMVLTVAVLVGTVVFAFRFHLLDESKPVGTYEQYGREHDVYADEMPLVLEDLMDTGDLEFSREKHRQASPLAAKGEYWQWALADGMEPELRYTILDIENRTLYNHCLNHLLEKEQDFVEDGEVLEINHYEEIPADSWGADAAWRLYYHGRFLERYLLCYGSRIVELHPESTPTPAQQAVICEKLKP